MNTEILASPMPLISVCLASFNGQNYIKDQLVSILNQIGSFDEVIICDDLSTDATIEVVNLLKDPRIKVFKNDKCLGVTLNFEKAIKLASGRYIFLSDQDDIWLPGKVEVCIKALQDHCLVIHDCEVVLRDRDGNLGDIITTSYFDHINFTLGIFKNLIRTRCLGCCMAFRSEVIKYALPFPRKINGHDAWINHCSSLAGSRVAVHQNLLTYTRHLNNSSSFVNKSMTIHRLLDVLSRKICFLGHFILRVVFVKTKNFYVNNSS